MTSGLFFFFFGKDFCRTRWVSLLFSERPVALNLFSCVEGSIAKRKGANRTL